MSVRVNTAPSVAPLFCMEWQTYKMDWMDLFRLKNRGIPMDGWLAGRLDDPEDEREMPIEVILHLDYDWKTGFYHILRVAMCPHHDMHAGEYDKWKETDSSRVVREWKWNA